MPTHLYAIKTFKGFLYGENFVVETTTFKEKLFRHIIKETKIKRHFVFSVSRGLQLKTYFVKVTRVDIIDVLKDTAIITFFLGVYEGLF